ncbi:MAG: ABC transporter permease subunit [Spirochaetes bacterium]|nr:ABC transporter permease subunit [Spirochaetota bacterium]
MNLKKILKVMLIYILLLIAIIVTVYPILRIFTISLRPYNKVMSTDLSIIPENFTFQNYKDLFIKKPFFLWLKNSLLISILTAFVSTILAVSAGYAFSRFNFPGRKLGMIFLLVSQMLPATMLLIPLYVLLAKMKIISIYIKVVIVYSSSALPFSIWLLKGYFDTIPIDIEESGLIDGAPIVKVFYDLILPLAKPAVGITFLFSFMTAWSDYIIARVIITKKELFTWPLGIDSMQGQFQTEYGMFAAASLLLAIPVVILFMYTSKYLISGLTLGSVKN